MFSWIQRKGPGASSRTRRPAQAMSYRPQVEALEGRDLLSHCLLQFSSTAFRVREGKEAVITVVRTRFDHPDISVQVNIRPGTATAGVDYTGPSLVTLFWADGETGPKTFTIPARSDGKPEPNETVRLSLSNPTGGSSLTSPFSATLTIVDRPPALSINDVSILEGNDGTRNAVFFVTLSAPSRNVVTVHFITVNGTALAGKDYVAIPDTQLTFLPGQIRRKVKVQVKGDLRIEADETFFVNLRTPTNATLADRHGVGTILNDDPSI